MNRRQQGFTLIEVLVAVSISAILLVSIYGVFTSMSVITSYSIHYTKLYDAPERMES